MSATGQSKADLIAALKAFQEKQRPFKSFNCTANGVPVVSDGETELMTVKEAKRVIQTLYDDITAVQAALASEPEPKPVAEGWVLVPVEPTQAMIDAGLIEGSDDPEHEASCIGHQWVRREIYQAMVMHAASPHQAEEKKP